MTAEFTQEGHFPGLKSFLLQKLHQYDRLLTAGGIRIFQNIIGHHNGA